jgi:hypothetical protein
MAMAHKTQMILQYTLEQGTWSGLVKSTIDPYTVEYKGTFLSVISVDKYLLTDHQYFHVTLTTNQKAELKILIPRSVVVTVIESDNGVDKSYFAAGVPAKST